MWSAGEGGVVGIPCPGHPDMILVPAGRVTLGSNDGEPDERPAKSIYLDAYCLDRYEFTNQDKARVAPLVATQWTVSTIACGTGVKTEIDRTVDLDDLLDAYQGEVDYVAVCGLEAQPFTRSRPPQSPKGFDNPKQPLIANWSQADAICTAQGKRLPTEAEWERAARGRNGTCLFGTKSCTELKHNEALFDSRGPTVNVDKYPPTDMGFYGLAGNVWEWASDWYWDEYYTYRGDNPQGPSDNDSRRRPDKVFKGGSWNEGPAGVRAAFRSYFHPFLTDGWLAVVGFRCAVSPISADSTPLNGF